MKKWGAGEYWGVSSDHDPEWLLTERQKKLRDDLIELCRVKIRPLAVSYTSVNVLIYLPSVSSGNVITDILVQKFWR